MGITIAMKVKTRGGLINLRNEDGVICTVLKTATEAVEVLYEQEKLSIEWAILDLIYVFGYGENEIKEVEIIKYWLGETRPQSDPEPTGVDQLEAGSDIRVLPKRKRRKVSNKKSISS